VILSAQSILAARPLSPLVPHSFVRNGLSGGLSAAGYDVTAKEPCVMWPKRFKLASTFERFTLPADIAAIVSTKSTWARRGVVNIGTTYIDPGFQGWLTLELYNYSWRFWRIREGDPIAQIIFFRLDEATDRPYAGFYQGQENRPVPARLEGGG
jgi:dCTP deaminase